MYIDFNNISNELDRLFKYAINNKKYIFDATGKSNGKVYQINIKTAGVWKLFVITDKQNINIQSIYVDDNQGNWNLL